MANTTVDHKQPEISLWLVDPLSESEWPQDDNLIRGMCLQTVHEQVASLNSGRDGMTERFVVRDQNNEPLFA